MSSQQNNSDTLSPRKKLSNQQQPQGPKPPKNHILDLFKLILPPFIVTIIAFLYRIISNVCIFIWSLFQSNEEQAGEASKQFHKRRFQRSIESLKLKQQQLGFTNQVLFQENKKSINFFLPVYITNKIKSIQDISIQSLTGNISCALIINVHYGQIPEQIVHRLQTSILVQLNKGQAIQLRDDGITITTKRDKKARFIIFTIRKVFLGFLIEDTLWSPFQIIELIISLTLNTVTVAPNSIKQILQPSTGYNPNKQYKISFNCMRNSDLIPISFGMDCVYGVYDLAQRLLQTYHSKFGTYKQIERQYEESLKSKSDDKGKKKQSKKQALKLKQKTKQEQKKKQQNGKQLYAFLFLKDIADSTMKRLSMRHIASQTKKPPKKVKYFQYTHFVIPLYKYPGNSVVTIFLPILLLALLSLAIFFQGQQLSGRIGTIATMILGYIALIPSIKQQLPPSSKLTVIETLVYIETLCCMLCLYQSFIIRNEKDYVFVWQQNFNFLLCLCIHSSTFLFVGGLYAIHKLKWQPAYNCDEKIPEIKPADSPHSWDNPYCDQVFSKFNQDIIAKETGSSRQQQLIRIYKNPLTQNGGKDKKKSKEKIQQKGKHLEQIISISKFQDSSSHDMLSSTVISISGPKKTQQKKQQPINFFSFLAAGNATGNTKLQNEFVPPDEKLYYQSHN